MLVKILGWIKPEERALNVIESENPNCEIEIIEKNQIKKFIMKSFLGKTSEDVNSIYVLCPDLNTLQKRVYFQAMGLICRCKIRKLIDSNGSTGDCSWSQLLFVGLPRIFLDFLLGGAVFVLNLVTLKLLSSQIVYKLIRCRSPENLFFSKRRILYFWSEFPDSVFDYRVGGEVSHIVGFFSGLKKLNYDSCLVSTRPIAHEHFSAKQEIVDEKGLPGWPGEIKPMAYNWKAFFKVRPLISSSEETFLYHRISEYSFIGVLVSLFYRIPVILEVNSLQVWEAKNWGGTRFPKILELTEKVNLLYAFKIAVVSDELRESLLLQGIPDNKVIVNPNGVDPNFFTPGHVETKKTVIKYGLLEKTVVGFIGSFAPYHGILTLARAIKLVKQEIPEIHFLLIGDGPLRKDLEDIVTADGVWSCVSVTGKVPHEKVPELLDACHILASPHQNMADGSPFFGSPTKIFEYMAMGKGIVASRIGQLEQILEHDKTALLVNPEDHEDLANNIIKMASDKDLRQTLGQAARERVVSSYTWEKNVERVFSGHR